MKPRTTIRVLIAVLACAASVPAAAQRPFAVDVAVYSDSGTWDAGIIAFEHFLDWKGLTHERVDAAAVNSGVLPTRYRCFYVPGGYSYDYARAITTRGERSIRDLVDAGGAYIGICAGAYYAADHVDWEGGSYPYTLGLFRGTARGALAEIAPWPDYTLTTIRTNPLHPVTREQPRTLTTLYFGGPAFLPDADFPVDTLATWDAAGDQCAIIGFPYGSGRVLLVGPHPEIEENDARDGSSFGFELNDPESEWSFLWAATDWVLGQPVSDTITTPVAPIASSPASKCLALSSGRPNPFTSQAFFTLSAAAPERATITVHDMLGRTVATLFDGDLAPGRHTLRFDATQNGLRLPAGRYLVRARSIDGTQTVPVLLVR
jgi:glutamine amidotransferase-like uncharacterized protein